ncbi:MAG TPA: ethanolamine ammonia-lyase reactivating factor EutA [Pirellulales bacterium]|jgi:ethanolamine utilization protein EutA|nr:ethanolamine ammonia-lyase reactivating factor EutA [Pirellulales bacterium]
MAEPLTLAGFDFGSTTSRCVLAQGSVRRHAVTGRMELADVQLAYAPQAVFTPFAGDSLDAAALASLLDEWIGSWGTAPTDVTAGAIVTGLAARAANADAVARLVRQRLGDTLIATADDPALEAWLAFMGNAAGLSRAEPDRTFVNLDIGGGTTNFAAGRAGQVRSTGCYYLGARHLRFEPGTHTLAGVSTFGARLLDELGLVRGPGDELSTDDVTQVVDFYVAVMEAVLLGDDETLQRDVVAFHRQLAFRPPSDRDMVITLSGGVGELAYRCHRGEALPATTAYGDLGIELARRIAASPLLSRDLASETPAELGRATVCGLAIHNTQISGATTFLPRPDLLPLGDLPIVGRLGCESGDDEMAALVALASRGARGACLAIDALAGDHPTIASWGGRLAAALERSGYPPERPLVLLVTSNIGKTLGNYATRWGRLSVQLTVVDEVAPRDARFASLGRLRENVVPVVFYG